MLVYVTKTAGLCHYIRVHRHVSIGSVPLFGSISMSFNIITSVILSPLPEAEFTGTVQKCAIN